MKIKIEDYKNIRQLDLELKDKAVNLVSGVCGSGKSSIARALSGARGKLDLRAGSETEEPLVETTPGAIAIDLFDERTHSEYCIEEYSDGLYRVMLKKGDSHREAEKTYEKTIEELRDYEEIVRNEATLLKRVIEGALVKFASGNKIKTNCSFSTTKKAIEESPNERIQLMKERGNDYLTWLVKGTSFEEWANQDKSCPFCTRKIPEPRIEYIDQVTGGNTKPLAKMEDVLRSLEDAGFDTSKISTSGGMQDAELHLKAIKDNLDAYEHLLTYIALTSRDVRSCPKPEESLNPHHPAFTVIEGLTEAIERSLTAAAGLRRSFGVLSTEFRNTLENNGNEINQRLDELGIPYIFALDNLDDDEKKMSFKLVHKDSDGDLDYRTALSYGEKNMVALILFLLEPHDEDRLVIIDDPVSSYDETRRGIITRMIMETLGGHTVLILSHDHVFPKYALFYHAKAKNKEATHQSMSDFEIKCLHHTGLVLLLDNVDGNAHFHELDKNQYRPMTFHISGHLKDPSLTLYQQIINLRLFLEAKGRESDAERFAYSYLSALLHLRQSEDFEEEKEALAKQLAAADICALDDWTQGKFGITLPSLQAISESDIKASTESFPLFDRLVAMREDEKDSSIKAEMSDIVHMNTALVYCLNPYKYPLLSRRLREHLRSA